MKQTIIELRKRGFTYQEIGEQLGISRQRVHQIVGNQRLRKEAVDIEKIVFEGIYQIFKEDKSMTFFKFANIAYGYYPTRKANTEQIRNWLTGKRLGAKLNINHIWNILNYAKQPFEVVFAERNRSNK